MPPMTERYVRRHVHLRIPRPLRLGFGATTSANDRLKDCRRGDLGIEGLLSTQGSCDRAAGAARIVSVRWVDAVIWESADREDSFSSGLNAGLAAIASRWDG